MVRQELAQPRGRLGRRAVVQPVALARGFLKRLPDNGRRVNPFLLLALEAQSRHHMQIRAESLQALRLLAGCRAHGTLPNGVRTFPAAR